ncbi:MAG: F0F1 ATP synthase subunit B [Patescibacteria group bacterium]
MEQLLDVFGIDWRLLIAQVINFLVLLGALSYFLYGPVMRALKERADKIAEGLRDAELAAADRATVAAEKGGIIAEAHHEGELIVARAEAEGKSERASIVKIAEDRAAVLLKDAQLEAEEAKRAALKASEAEIAKSAILAAEKILAHK